MTPDEQKRNIFAAVLAAGSATRFGSTKQLATLNGAPLVQRVANVATVVCANNVLLVLGHDWQAVRDACNPFLGFVVVNDRYADGLGSSIASATRSVCHVAQAIVVLLADQALISAEHVQALCDAWSGADDEIVATAYADTVGAPVLFPRSCFAELAGLRGDSGGRHLLSDERFRLKEVVFEPAAVDVDTPDDLRRISRNARS
ncbi:MAG: nucleotidyltransferase family protein [Gammaproteobacteria bacterium]|nr:nucleotidyltransferase family protein [Gammaproteobacteria bacterium]MDH3373309.1 nucleotidyltransferase family protein [Gammaproteobacteria bacterium]MDH3409830.1 nucleotidyltransferase family protein [Gammaproteobacteria bacterium]MDH3554063.1 nucleotidyltransferase family protein [Gammaproteobacteria bacterium]